VTPDPVERLRGRASTFGIEVSNEHARQLLRYVTLLERWNQRINLTALPLAGLPDASMDRLLFEPAVAARLVPSDAQDWIDVGSGGGSPAIPLKILKPALRLTMVESRSRKAAFLREATRQLGLLLTDVVDTRLEDLAASRQEAADLVTSRGVRLDTPALDAIARILRASGCLMVFGDGHLANDSALKTIERVPLPTGGGELTILLRRE
jgi:16S rRNA (guanine527-N7)-methyltransferase